MFGGAVGQRFHLPQKQLPNRIIRVRAHKNSAGLQG
jgi:hypothetical protein